jgi:hypothetical protein
MDREEEQRELRKAAAAALLGALEAREAKLEVPQGAELREGLERAQEGAVEDPNQIQVKCVELLPGEETEMARTAFVSRHLSAPVYLVEGAIDRLREIAAGNF